MESVVRKLIPTTLVCLLVSWSVVSSTPVAKAARIEAVKGKRYTLTKRHGPCMIMVASLKTREGVTDGPSAEQAADALVYELRSKGIPAYTFKTKEQFGSVNTFDRRTGQARQRRHRVSDGRVVVMAGNYPEMGSKIAEETLHYVKRFKPRSFGDKGRYVKTPGRNGPLGGAFLSFNPLLSLEERAKRVRNADPLIKQMNSRNGRISIKNNKGQYTLVVASFFGKTSKSAQWGGNLDAIAAKFKLTNPKNPHGSELQRGMWESEFLAELLRQRDFQNKLQKHVGETLESYVYHDHHSSVVTLGSFDRPDDPRIVKLQKLFGSKVRQNPQTGRNVLTAEIVEIPGGKPIETGRTAFLFDPSPRLIGVPVIY